MEQFRVIPYKLIIISSYKVTNRRSHASSVIFSEIYASPGLLSKGKRFHILLCALLAPNRNVLAKLLLNPRKAFYYANCENLCQKER